MRIVVLTGSHHKNGTSALLAEKFIEGAAEIEGNEITRFDCAFKNIHGCNGCEYCTEHSGQCVFEDDMEQIKDRLIDADMIVFVTPLYFYGMTAQLKLALDRFYAFNDKLRARTKKTVLLMTCADNESWAADGILAHYTTMLRYMKWEDAGMVLAQGVSERKDIEKTDYPSKAKALAKEICR